MVSVREGGQISLRWIERFASPGCTSLEVTKGGMGIQMMNSVARSLGGRVARSLSDRGFEATLTFPALDQVPSSGP